MTKKQRVRGAQRTPEHQAAVLGRRTSGAAGTHRTRRPRATERRRAIAEQTVGPRR